MHREEDVSDLLHCFFIFASQEKYRYEGIYKFPLLGRTLELHQGAVNSNRSVGRTVWDSVSLLSPSIYIYISISFSLSCSRALSLSLSLSLFLSLSLSLHQGAVNS